MTATALAAEQRMSRGPVPVFAYDSDAPETALLYDGPAASASLLLLRQCLAFFHLIARSAEASAFPSQKPAEHDSGQVLAETALPFLYDADNVVADIAGRNIETL